MDALDGKYKDHVMEYAARTGVHLTGDTIQPFFSQATSDIQVTIENFNQVLDPAVQEAAFGAPGTPGDPDRIAHLAKRYASVYEDLMDWSATLRGASTSGEHGRRSLRTLAKAADQPVQAVRDFVSDYVEVADTMLEKTQNGEALDITMTVTFELDDGLMDSALEELKRAMIED
jgi:hypothetical protein